MGFSTRNVVSLHVVRRGVNRLNDLPPTLVGQDRERNPVRINAVTITEKGLLVGIPAKPLPWFATFLQKVREISPPAFGCFDQAAFPRGALALPSRDTTMKVSGGADLTNMIGFRAFLNDAALPFVSLLILLLITIVVIHSVERRVKATGAVAIVILVLLSANGVFRLVKQIGYRRALHSITADSVESVQIGDTKIQDHADVAAVVNALRQSQWFTSEHGGWAEEVDLVIHFKSGTDQRYEIARYLRREGAVIDYVGQGDDSHFVRHYGYSFAEQLPGILQRLGAPLPSSKKRSLR